jgi:hypothetical protein
MQLCSPSRGRSGPGADVLETKAYNRGLVAGCTLADPQKRQLLPERIAVFRRHRERNRSVDPIGSIHADLMTLSWAWGADDYGTNNYPLASSLS